MKAIIIIYNKKATRISMLLFHTGFIFLFINIIPFVWNNYGMTIVYIGVTMLFLGATLVNYFTKKVKKNGYILIEKDKTKISTETSQLELINQEYQVKFSNTGYKGRSNYIPFLTIGSFTTNPGVNTICFYNKKKEFNYEILIKSEIELNKLKNILKKTYKSSTFG